MDLGWLLRPVYEQRLEVITTQRKELIRRIQGAENLIADHRERLARLHTEEAVIRKSLDEGKVSI